MHRRHVGPLLVQRPFYPERDGTCHSYVLHPPGGVAGGDSLDIRISVEPDARCLLTSPGATKVYRTPGNGSRQRIGIDIADGAVCELMPMETILFNAARSRFETEIRLQGNGVFFGWDLVSLGRPAAGERFSEGLFDQRMNITRDGEPIWYERAQIDGGSAILDAAHGFGGHPIFGAAIHAGRLPEGAIDRLHERVPPATHGLGAITQINDLIVCRYIGSKVSAGRSFFAAAWKVLRQLGQGKDAVVPRIWAT
ncbi:urease accessory protein UreD [Sedimentitalea sp. JM2-8]|uniref:Urease accessory protein UreD n=1 Tax=Sedimentitalea xiamensis TaxID=3050037 RepID=A0ABT7FCR5_9RHOB|nr:urease accessory protein UreD [Sedimentitalea xiamensis]MDK3072909.1 urease accessory protein UreD [Sedimentitalea xiamensis]